MPSDLPDFPTSARHKRLFRNGRNQAVRIPREFGPAAEEVMIFREKDRLVMIPVERPPSLAEVLSRLGPLEADFPEFPDPPARPEDLL